MMVSSGIRRTKGGKQRRTMPRHSSLGPVEDLLANFKDDLLLSIREVVQDEIKSALKHNQVFLDPGEDHSSIPISNDDSTSNDDRPIHSQSHVNQTTEETFIEGNHLDNKEEMTTVYDQQVCIQLPKAESETEKKRKRRQTNDEDIEECYANALQTNLEKIVDVLEYRDSSLPDILVSDGHITENESQSIRNLSDRKDQVRALISIIKGRNESALKALYDEIQKAHKKSKLASDLKEKLEQNIRNKLNSKICTICKIKKSVDVKYVIDGLMSKCFISDGLYNDCVWTDKHTGSQDYLWNRIFDGIESLTKERFCSAYETLVSILQEKNHYNHLATGLKKCFEKCNCRIHCTCKCVWPLQRFSSTELVQSSVSPESSHSEKDSCHSLSTNSDREQNNAEDQQCVTMEGHIAGSCNDNKIEDELVKTKKEVNEDMENKNREEKNRYKKDTENKQKKEEKEIDVEKGWKKSDQENIQKQAAEGKWKEMEKRHNKHEGQEKIKKDRERHELEEETIDGEIGLKNETEEQRRIGEEILSKEKEIGRRERY